MTELPPLPPAPPHRRSRRRPIILGIVALLVVGAATAAGVWWLQRGPDYPDQWDAKVKPYVDYVEKERGLKFEHPVYVDFLTDAEFDKQVTSTDSDLDDKDRKEVRRFEGMLRALGLLPAGVDLLDAVNELSRGSVIGLYDYEDKRIRMRGTTLTLPVRSTLVHELTHVLQDQHYDLEEVAEEQEKDEDTAAESVWQGLVEGDADRVEEAWAASLPKAQRVALTKAQAAQSKASDKAIAKVPPFLSTSLAAPYALGGGLLQLAVALHGKGAVDDLFASPPPTEEALVDPWTHLADKQGRKPVDAPKLADGEKEFDAGSFGAPSLLFVLAERIDPLRALTATDGWGGDQYVAFERGGRSCVRLDYVGDNPGHTTELRAALQTWVARGPRGFASVRPHGDGLRFESCDPGKRARKGTGGSREALQLAVVRTQLGAEVVPQGLPRKFVRCYVDRIVHAVPIDQLTTDADVPGLEARVTELAKGCA